MNVERRDTLKFLSAEVPHLTPEGLSHFKQHVISHANVLYCIAKLLYCKSLGLVSLGALRTAALPLCAGFICMCFNSLLKKTSVGGPQHMVCWGCRCAGVPARLLNLLLSARLPWSTRLYQNDCDGDGLVYRVYRGCSLSPLSIRIVYH